MKLRIFVRPPGRPSTLLELAVPEAGSLTPVQLKCFSPPPDATQEQAEYGETRAWAVEVPPGELDEVLGHARDFRVLPFVNAKPRGHGSPVEVTISEGQAEARASWWMSAPEGWGPMHALVTRVVEISQRGGTALPVVLEEPDEEDDPVPAASPKKPGGFFSRLIGG